MPLENLTDRILRLDRQLRTFDLPAPIRTEMVLELEQLRLAEDDARSRRLAELAATNGPDGGTCGTERRASLEALVDQIMSGDPLHPVVLQEDIDRFEKDNVTGDKDLDRRNKAFLKKIRELGQFRDLRKLPSDWQRRLARLERQFPNFREPIEYLRASLYTSGRKDGAIYFSPMLLDGPPGVGKTMFCEEFAKAFRLSFTRIDMASAQSGSLLAGSDIFWANTRPGRVFNEVLLGETANPLFVLDELDKANGDERYPVANALYPLLEPHTARQFEDLSFPGLRFDASRVLWIGTSNDCHRLDGPILDRMRVFSIKAPRPEAMRRIVEQTLDAALSELRLSRRDVTLGKAQLRQLAQLPPRVMKRTITESIALTVLRRGRKLQIAGGSCQARPAVGFV